MMLISMLVGVSSRQCAAVSTAVGEMSEPPQGYKSPLANSSSSRAMNGVIVSGEGACARGERAR